jgi:hypothetical protein
VFVRVFLLIGFVVLVLWGLHWLRRTPPQKVAATLRKAAVYGGIGLVLALVLTGRLNPLFAALAAAVPAIVRVANLVRLLPVVQQVLRGLGLVGASGAAGAPGGGQTSSIRTRFLDMTLDHATGRMDGTVREGTLSGRRLSDLTLDQVMALLDLCRAQDQQSATILETYLDRERGEVWRDQDSGPGAGAGGQPGLSTRMDRDEALRILGLADGATDEEVRAAHRRLMQRFHPDRGGSDYLAAKINEAKRLLLRE